MSIPGYDSWKLRSDRDEFPDDEPYDDAPEDECDHMDYELDILTGRAECPTCGHRWFMSDAELKHDEELRQMPYPGDEE